MTTGELIANAGESHAAIARRLGVDKSLVTRWRSGSRTPSPKHLARLQSLYGEGASPAAPVAPTPAKASSRDSAIRSLSPVEVARFESKARRDDGCWVWSGQKTTSGYGLFSVSRAGDVTDVAAHRVAYFLANSRLPKLVRHRCDNPACVNPAHLVAGSHADNTADMVSRGRHGQAKLTPDDVRLVRVLHVQGLPQRAIALRFGVSVPSIRRIVNGRGWKAVA